MERIAVSSNLILMKLIETDFFSLKAYTAPVIKLCVYWGVNI